MKLSPVWFRSKLNGVSGGQNSRSQDPTYTRWLPLAFSPTVSSQPFRTQPGALPALWGNVNCAYSIAMQREPGPPNLDLNGQVSLFVPSGPYGNFNAPGPPYNPLYGPFVPYYAITDANGDRLVFDKHWNPYSDIHRKYDKGTASFRWQRNCHPVVKLLSQQKALQVFPLRSPF